MNQGKHLIKLLLCAMLMALLGGGSVAAAELDDSELFVEAFKAYQNKDYLLAIEKTKQIAQFFPETPLRDVSLLLLARAGLKSGDNELAASTINQFNTEFTDSSLKASLEDELVALAARKKKGEHLAFDKQLQLIAQKVRNDQLAIERAAALKAEQTRLALEKEERDRIAREKALAERKELERIAAEKAAKESIKLAIVFNAGHKSIGVGKNGQIPFELINNGATSEEFLLTASTQPELPLVVTSAGKSATPLERIKLASGQKFSGQAMFQMPANRVDGYKNIVRLKVMSTKFEDVNFSNETSIITSAPLVRSVIKPVNPTVAKGQTIRYRVAVLNAGSLAAKDLSIRVILPAQLEFIDAAGAGYHRESADVVTFNQESLETGRLVEYNLNVRVRAGARDKDELRCKVEVINPGLQIKEVFTSTPAMVQDK